MQGSKAVQEIAMAHPPGRKPEPTRSGSTNRSFATRDPERQGAPPRQKAPSPRSLQVRPVPPAPPRHEEPREEEDAQAHR
jgi:hypothetical protein